MPLSIDAFKKLSTVKEEKPSTQYDNKGEKPAEITRAKLDSESCGVCSRCRTLPKTFWLWCFWWKYRVHPEWTCYKFDFILHSAYYRRWRG